MKYEQLKNCMDLTEDIDETIPVKKRYLTKHGTEIQPDQMQSQKDTKIETEFEGETSHKLTIFAKQLADAKQKAKEARAAIDESQDKILNIYNKTIPVWEKAYANVLLTQSMMMTVNKLTKKDPTFNFNAFMDKLLKKFPEHTKVFEKMIEDSTTQPDPENPYKAQSIRADTIKREGIADLTKSLYNSLVNFIIPTVNEYRQFLKIMKQDLETIGSEFKSGMDDMIEDPDYYTKPYNSNNRL